MVEIGLTDLSKSGGGGKTPSPSRLREPCTAHCLPVDDAAVLPYMCDVCCTCSTTASSHTQERPSFVCLFLLGVYICIYFFVVFQHSNSFLEVPDGSVSWWRRYLDSGHSNFIRLNVTLILKDCGISWLDNILFWLPSTYCDFFSVNSFSRALVYFWSYYCPYVTGWIPNKPENQTFE